jgi:ribonuclease HIII
MDNAIARLEWLLTRLEVLDSPDRESEEKKQLYQEICKLVFEDQLYVRIWSEPTLNRLNQLFQTEKPGEELFDAELEEIRKRTIAVKEVNNLFFSIVDPTTTIKDHCELLAKFECLPKNFIERLDASGRLQEIRNQDRCTLEKVTCFLEILKDDFNLDLTTKDSIKGTLESLKSRETVGIVNALLVQGAAKAIAVSLHVKLQAGSGQVWCQISGSDNFKEAVARAQSAMRDRGFLSGSEDIFYSLELTDARYHGSSLAVAAAVAMHDVKLNLATDPYTAFTGDINLDGQEWAIKPVSGVSQKIVAAKRAGCRRVFIPSLNCAEVTAPPDVKIFGVDSLTDLFIQLRPGRQLLPSGSLQGRKVTTLQQYCMNHGWDLSPPQPIQAGIQFSIVPLEIPPLKVQIYNTGTHTPKTTSQNEYLELLSILNATDQPETPIRSINQTLTVQSSMLQGQIQSEIEKLGPTESRTEQYCKYFFKFIGKNEALTVKQYNSGKLTIQGLAGTLYKSVLDCIVPLYNVHFPNSEISVDRLLGLNTTTPVPQAQASNNRLIEVPLPHIGTDESGKGDYFGPMVIAGVLIDSVAEAALKGLGVKDSKTLTDKRCKELAVKIRNLLPERYHEVEILPERYNQLYEELKTEGKNLNHLLAWGHARAIESLLQKETCSHAIADQFGDENYIRSKLMDKGKKLKLIQLPKGERYLAVAAASILARDRFLSRMESFRDSYKIELPKGASDSVITAGKQFVQTYGDNSLEKIAKLHHKTTEKIKGPKND